MPSRFALLCVLTVFFGCSDGSAGSADAQDAGAVTPQEVTLTPVTASQLTQSIQSSDAEVTVLNVWATWCGPCRMEFPEFVRFGQDYADEGVAVRFLSVDDPDMQPQALRFLAEHGVSGTSYFSDEGTGIVAPLAQPFNWTFGIPATIVMGPDGTVHDFWEGAVTYDFLQVKVKRVQDIVEGAAG